MWKYIRMREKGKKESWQISKFVDEIPGEN